MARNVKRKNICFSGELINPKGELQTVDVKTTQVQKCKYLGRTLIEEE